MRRRKKLLTLLFGGTIFLSAFLLFQVQPIIGKMLLPWFGGSAVVCIGLFVSCMLGHGELARLKPHPAHLTSFYLMIALGGALGGTFVAFVAPRVFNGNYEP